MPFDPQPYLSPEFQARALAGYSLTMLAKKIGENGDIRSNCSMPKADR